MEKGDLDVEDLTLDESQIIGDDESQLLKIDQEEEKVDDEIVDDQDNIENQGALYDKDLFA